MIKQIKSSEIKKFIDNNPNTVLLDVRTEDEWNTLGKPKAEDLNFKTINHEINTFVTNVFLSFGYNTWNFYLSYPLTPIFNSKITNPKNR